MYESIAKRPTDVLKKEYNISDSISVYYDANYINTQLGNLIHWLMRQNLMIQNKTYWSYGKICS
jgi:hypothetical protein